MDKQDITEEICMHTDRYVFDEVDAKIKYGERGIVAYAAVPDGWDGIRIFVGDYVYVKKVATELTEEQQYWLDYSDSDVWSDGET